jgi:hypothetical protein
MKNRIGEPSTAIPSAVAARQASVIVVAATTGRFPIHSRNIFHIISASSLLFLFLFLLLMKPPALLGDAVSSSFSSAVAAFLSAPTGRGDPSRG